MSLPMLVLVDDQYALRMEAAAVINYLAAAIASLIVPVDHCLFVAAASRCSAIAMDDGDAFALCEMYRSFWSGKITRALDAATRGPPQLQSPYIAMAGLSPPSHTMVYL